MKVEIVKVKISKLREVKRQLKKGKTKNEHSLKKLLLSESIEQRENDVHYKSIKAIFQEEDINEDRLKESTCSEKFDYVDFDELLKSLELHQTSIPLEEQPSSNFTEDESQIKSEKTVVHSSTNSLQYTISNENNDTDQHSDEIYLNNREETESILMCSDRKANFNTEKNINNTRCEPSMVELEQYYAPDKESTGNEVVVINEEDFCNEIEISTTDDSGINEEDFCNEIEISTTDDSGINEEDFCNEIEISTTDDSGINEEDFCNEIEISTTDDSGINEETDKEVEADVTKNPDTTENTLVNPMEINCSGVDLKVIAMNQLQKQTNDRNETENLIEMELLNNYSSEQKKNIIAAAKMLYTKRTRTLLHWLDPKLPLSKMKPTLGTSWMNLPMWQKEVYITQVLGPLVVETVSPMLNPQLTAGGFETATPTLANKSYYKSRGELVNFKKKKES